MLTPADYVMQLPRYVDLPFATWRIGKRRTTRYVTIHWNGPRVPGFGYRALERAQIKSDARWHMRPGALGAKSGGDGIQYHGGTYSDGYSEQYRDWNDLLWHCANFEGNEQSISWHCPLGGDQEPTRAQLEELTRIIDGLRARFNVEVSHVRGHLEWSSTGCPGTVMPFVRAYRDAHMARPIQWFKTIYNANVRTAPDVHSAIALNGAAVTPKGTKVAIGAIIENGVPYNGNATYGWRADGLGFYHISVIAPIYE